MSVLLTMCWNDCKRCCLSNMYMYVDDVISARQGLQGIGLVMVQRDGGWTMMQISMMMMERRDKKIRYRQ